jgi:Virulence-associated protein E
MKIWVTIFDDVFAKSCRGEDMTVDELAELIKNTRAPKKSDLPLLKFARFGPLRTPTTPAGGGGSLRHDANVTMASGVEGDYDGETMPFAEAVTRLEEAGIAFLAYTSPSYTSAAPRWRVVCPFATEQAPAVRAAMVNRLNGVLGGVLHRESWTLSQAFYFGQVNGVDFELAIGSGDECIDEADDLEPGLPYQPSAGQNTASGAGKSGKSRPDYAVLSEFELLDLIQTGGHYHGPASELARRWAYQEVPQPDTESNLIAAFDKVPATHRDRKWSKARSSVGRWVQKAYTYVAKRKGAFFRSLVAHFEEPDWRGAIRLNLFTQTIEVCTPFPPRPGQTLGTYLALADPQDILETMMVVQENGFPNAGKNIIRDALLVVATRRPHHPVRDWLDSLEWDGTHRLNRLFLDYFPGELPDAQDQGRRDAITSYYEKIGESFLVGAVARVFEPGCKVDCLPVVLGQQRWKKSRAIQALVPVSAWFSDDLSTTLIDRDSKESLTGKWIIELAEFPHIRREVEKVKAFFSRQVDRFRRAYDRANRDWPRQCAFIASTNELEFFDMTGNRRFWPILLVRPVDVDAIVCDREQLWAEAVYLYRQGFSWWLTPSLEAIAAEVQDAFLEDDIWDGPIADWIDRKAPRDVQGKLLPFSTRAVLQGLGYGLTPEQGDKRIVATKLDEMRVTRCLKRLRYVRDRNPKLAQGRRERFWRQPEYENSSA